MSKQNYIHKDVMGTILEVGDHVVSITPYAKALMVCEIVRFSPKQVRLKYITHSGEISRFPDQIVKVLGEDALAYILRNAK